MKTRGIRNNNPGNIRRTSRSMWLGMREKQEDKAFLQFKDMVHGLRAMWYLLHQYRYQYNCSTIQSIIHRWAPASDGNNERDYVTFIVNRTGIPATRKLIWDYEYKAVISAMCQMESNFTPSAEQMEMSFKLYLQSMPPTAKKAENIN